MESHISSKNPIFYVFMKMEFEGGKKNHKWVCVVGVDDSLLFNVILGYLKWVFELHAEELLSEGNKNQEKLLYCTSGKKPL